jgi:RNA polymerase sigma-70 factor, ECF subfamily
MTATLPETDTDAELIQRYRDGDQQAASLLYQKYAHRLRALAKSRCGRQCSGRFDPDDIVQSVFRVLFNKISNLDLVTEGSELWGLMIILTINKVKNLVQHHSAAKRSVNRTISYDAEDSTLEAIDPHSDDSMLRYVLNEQLSRLQKADRQVVKMRLEGYGITEIAVETARPQRTVERVLQQFREQVKSIL